MRGAGSTRAGLLASASAGIAGAAAADRHRPSGVARAGASPALAGLAAGLGAARPGAPALLSFNLGVEIGQAAIVALIFPLLHWLRRRPTLAMPGLRLGSLAIGAAGLVWLVQRLP